ncbi:MAG: rRNA (cytosine1962-C5)-methyltransferase [Chthoniobacter sp.]|nr:rRNA (cytosine1962-C5)-methyltransferase [Chthoniobacter sp.]
MFQKLAAAIAKREPLRAHETDALRIVDGTGDGFDDLEIDDFAGNWLVQTRDGSFPEWLREAADGNSLYWKVLGSKEAPQWIAGQKLEAPFVIRENGVRFEIDFRSGYSQGIFLDQRANRLAVRHRVSGKSVLNCFAYTCAFGVSAARGGAATLNLDLSKNYLEWGRRNYALNGLASGLHEFVFGDVTNWLNRFARKGRRFAFVVLDPPTFSRDERGHVFTIERGLPELVRAASQVLAREGSILCSTNQRSISPAGFRKLIFSGVEAPEKWRFVGAPMPPDFCGEPYLKSGWLSRL